MQSILSDLIDHDQGMNRCYIPLPGGWEIQTKGTGSSFRICDPKGRRINIPDEPYLHETLEKMGRDVHAAVLVNQKPELNYLRCQLEILERVCRRGRAMGVESKDNGVTDMFQHMLDEVLRTRKAMEVPDAISCEVPKM